MVVDLFTNIKIIDNRSLQVNSRKVTIHLLDNSRTDFITKFHKTGIVNSQIKKNAVPLTWLELYKIYPTECFRVEIQSTSDKELRVTPLLRKGEHSELKNIEIETRIHRIVDMKPSPNI